MCSIPDDKQRKPARAYWRKGNEPKGYAMYFNVEYTRCKCDSNEVVRVIGDGRWQIAERHKGAL